MSSKKAKVLFPGKKQVWGSHLSAPPDELMVAFCAGRDVTALPMADVELLPYDLWTNRAHARMLAKQGIITGDVLEKILEALETLESKAEEGNFQLDPTLEDVHVNVERFISQRHGQDVGGRLHTARSRNDQMACDIRLFMREHLLELAEGVNGLVKVLLQQADANVETIMPGFTHHQPAMITSWGHWLCGYAQGLLRDLERIRLAFDLMNRSPLGAAASFGTSWPIDRAYAADLLGFDGVDSNTLDAVSSRWEHEAQMAFIYAGLFSRFSVMAQDLILLSHPYWGMLSLPDAFVTGSSIMPQKRNPDLLEVVKGKASWVNGMVAGLLGIPKGNMSGYNRDTQWSKYSIMDVVRECQPGAFLLTHVHKALTVHPEIMRQRLEQGFLDAADFADALARALNLPFRESYDIAAVAVRKSGDAGRITPQAAGEAVREAGHDPVAAEQVLADLADPARILAWRQHQGSPSPDSVRAQVKELTQSLEERSAFIAQRTGQLAAARERCANPMD